MSLQNTVLLGKIRGKIAALHQAAVELDEVLGELIEEDQASSDSDGIGDADWAGYYGDISERQSDNLPRNKQRDKPLRYHRGSKASDEGPL